MPWGFLSSIAFSASSAASWSVLARCQATRSFANVHRPQRSSSLIPPEPPQPTTAQWSGGHIQRRDRLGGVIHEYKSQRDRVCEPFTLAHTVRLVPVDLGLP